MFTHFDAATRQMLMGNLFLIGCCLFYLAWWFIAFHPTRAIKGFKSGWLLIPAAILGLVAVVEIIAGSSEEGLTASLFSRRIVLIIGILVYILMLEASMSLFNRQVTTELFLIVGWAGLMAAELNALYGLGHYGKAAAILLIVISVVAAAVSLICYLLYYNLDSVKGYVDGAVPLILVTLMMIVVTVSVVVGGHTA